jgi:cytochrome c-type biogenesis protein CcmH/NrfG
MNDKLPPEERLLFEAQLLTSPLLRWNVSAQQRVYTLLKLYHRRKIKEQTQTVQQKLFQESQHAAWREQITQLFK